MLKKDFELPFSPRGWKERGIDPGHPMVAISFDDSPGGRPRKYLPQTLKAEHKILDVLEANGQVATYFCIGSRANFDDERKSIVRRAFDMGCEIGNHTWSHPKLVEIDDEEIKDQIDRTNAVLAEICGQEPTLFRPPYLNIDARVRKAVGMHTIMKTVSISHTFGTPEGIAERFKGWNLDGQLVLLHSNVPKIASLCEIILPWLAENGIQTVTVSELAYFVMRKSAARA